MNILLICIHVIVCFVLILVILLQAGRGQGLTGGGFGSGNVQSLLGTKASSFLTKATSISAVVFLFTCIGLNIMEVHKSRSLFQPKNGTAPLDVDQIRKALDKIKSSEAANKAKNAASGATPEAAAQAPQAPANAETASPVAVPTTEKTAPK